MIVPQESEHFSAACTASPRARRITYTVFALAPCAISLKNALVGRRSESYIFSALICCIKKSAPKSHLQDYSSWRAKFHICPAQSEPAWPCICSPPSICYRAVPRSPFQMNDQRPETFSCRRLFLPETRPALQASANNSARYEWL